MTLMLLVVLLQIKHFFVDFVFQTNTQIKYKGVYGHPDGIVHSLQHGLLSGLIFWIFFPFNYAFFAFLVDFFLHYHIDYVKMTHGVKDITSKVFWVQFGLDQLAHQLTYILLIILIAGN